MPAEIAVDAALCGAVLFTPGDRPERFAKGWSASREALILDLEDAVAVDRKPAARVAVAAWLESGRRSLVRLNAVSSRDFQDDVAYLSRSDLSGIVIPKANSAADIQAVRAVWPKARLYPLIESPWGLEKIKEIGRCDGVVQLLLGALDLHAACGMTYPVQSFLDYSRIQLVVASKVAGLSGPVDTPHPAFRDPADVANAASAAAKLGFVAKLCIHPAQIAPVNNAFLPSAEEIEWAREIVLAAKAGGAVAVRGAMVDAPVLASAEQILARGLRLRRDAEVMPS